MPFASLLSLFGFRAKHILLNKVALREGETIFTMEQIGAAKVPYQIRSTAAFTQEIGKLGYTIRDTWRISELGHAIPTHPSAGISQSCGYLLERER
ncbi:hypothetical protein ACFE33_06710 [Falsihalocynthiibacter sp. SS001]|uniref:hypothetical protein n=1 Tax=Falsihalocynthiibacter sp. SS001 TaxID=3349698 RepID=UPI0036D2770C